MLAQERGAERAPADVAQAHDGHAQRGTGDRGGRFGQHMATLFDPPQDAFGRVGSAPVARESPSEPARRPVRTDAGPPVLSVAELCSGVRAVLESTFDDVAVEGELSNVHLHRSGHLYFTLKDDEAQLRGVVWRTHAARIFFRVENGMQVRVRGRVSFYEARGEAQLVGHTLTLAGEGALFAALESLKERLRADGLFAHERKRTLPRFPRRVGLVTSASGAAVRDLLAVLGQRFPLAEVVLCGVAVQGLGAADEIAAAVARFGALPLGHPHRPDVLIVGRGGGSMEDLWAFNEEVVARAIAACPIPVVSAVGHETDVTVADFVADVRAATPTHAAELVVPDAREVAGLLAGYDALLRDTVRARLHDAQTRLLAARHAPAFARIPVRLAHATAALDTLRHRLAAAALAHTTRNRTRLDGATATLHAADPEAPLRRGYALASQHGQRVTAATLVPGAPVTLTWHDGTRAAQVTAPTPGPA